MTRTETTKSFPANCTCHLSEHSKFCPASRPAKANIEVRGMTVRAVEPTRRPQRRYMLVNVRPEPVPSARGGYYVAYATIVKRSDNLRTLQRAQSVSEPGPGAAAVIVDAFTGEEV